MADGVTANSTVIATDNVTPSGTTRAMQVQFVKIMDGTNGGTNVVPGSSARGLSVDPRPKRASVSATPTISTGAYVKKDAIGGRMTFAVTRSAAAGSVMLESVELLDKGQRMRDIDLVLFTSTSLTVTDSTLFNPSDANAATIKAIVSIGGGMYSDFSGNSVAHATPYTPIVTASSNIYAALVARSTTANYTSTTDIVVTLNVAQD